MMDVGALAQMVASARLDLSNEKAAQADLEAILRRELPDVDVQREVRLGPGDIIDFVVGGVGLEMKVSSASKPGIASQLHRYAGYPQLHGLVLASNTVCILPDRMMGKRVIFVSLGRAWL